MKLISQAALASLAIILAIAPSLAYAHGHSPTYRDHTPRVHEHHSHPHHG
jgi:hypothetical protein